MSDSRKVVTFGPPERFVDTDRGTTSLLQRRYEVWRVNGQKFGRWEWVPYPAPEETP